MTVELSQIAGRPGGRTGGGAAPRRATRGSDHLLAAVPAVWLFVFFFAPLALTTAISFGHSSFGSVAFGFTLENYRTALDGFYRMTFLRTLQFALTGCVLCLLVAFPAAFFIARRAGRFGNFAVALVLVPYFTSFLIRVMSWQILLSRGGPGEAVLHGLHLYSGRLDLMDTKAAVFIGMVYTYLPIAIVPLYVVLRRIPDTLEDAARDLGATRWRTFRHIVLPLARPGIATAVLLTGVPMLGEMVIPTLLGGDRGVLMGQAISSQYVDAQNYALGSAMAVLVLIAVAVLVALLARFTRGFAETGA